MRFPEKQYLHLVKRILKYGDDQKTRNGNTRALIGQIMRFPLSNNTMPLLTTKKVPWKTCLRELLWFIKGQTNNTNLLKQNVNIWTANASREFLDKRGLTRLRENDLGPIYGHQWRFFNAPYIDCDTDYTGQGVDQLENIVHALKNKTRDNSRRLILTAWNPLQIDEMALPPCHILAQFHITQGHQLSCSLYQRSGDVGLGIPFNIASYSFLTHLLAHHCNLKAKELIHFIGNAHIYDNHIAALTKQLKKNPIEFPKLILEGYCDNISDYKLNHFKVINYNPAKSIYMRMRP